jgi:hypothetical protein
MTFYEVLEQVTALLQRHGRVSYRALKRQFGFVVADGHFDLPAASISQDDLPGKLWGVGRFAGEQIPGGLSFASCGRSFVYFW